MPVGIHSPSTDHGRTSKYLPYQIGLRFNEAINDPHLLSIRTEVALLTARHTELLERLHSGESGSLWAGLKMLKQEFIDHNNAAREARQSDNFELAQRCRADAEECIKSMMRLIDEGARQETTWSEIIETAKDLVEFKRAEHARVKDLKQMLTVEQAMGFASALLEAVKQVVDDPHVQRQIADRLEVVIRSGEYQPGSDNTRVITPGKTMPVEEARNKGLIPLDDPENIEDGDEDEPRLPDSQAGQQSIAPIQNATEIATDRNELPPEESSGNVPGQG